MHTTPFGDFQLWHVHTRGCQWRLGELLQWPLPSHTAAARSSLAVTTQPHAHGTSSHHVGSATGVAVQIGCAIAPLSGPGLPPQPRVTRWPRRLTGCDAGLDAARATLGTGDCWRLYPEREWRPCRTTVLQPIAPPWPAWTALAFRGVECAASVPLHDHHDVLTSHTFLYPTAPRHRLPVLYCSCECMQVRRCTNCRRVVAGWTRPTGVDTTLCGPNRTSVLKLRPGSLLYVNRPWPWPRRCGIAVRRRGGDVHRAKPANVSACHVGVECHDHTAAMYMLFTVFKSKSHRPHCHTRRCLASGQQQHNTWLGGGYRPTPAPPPTPAECPVLYPSGLTLPLLC